MELDYSVESLESVPEGVREFYTERDGNFVLNARGVIPEAKYKKLSSDLDHMRNEYGGVSKKLESFAGVDPARYKELEVAYAQLKDSAGKPAEFSIDSLTDEQKKMIAPEVSKLFESRISNMQTEYQTKLDELAKEKDGYRDQIYNGARERAIREAMRDSRYTPNALDHALLLAERELKYKPEVSGESESDKIFTEDGISLNAWLEMNVAKYPGWLKASDAGAARGNMGSVPTNTRQENREAARKTGDVDGVLKNAKIIE